MYKKPFTVNNYSPSENMICEFAQEQERRRKAEVAAHSALNGPRVRAYEFAGPDFEVRWRPLQAWIVTTMLLMEVHLLSPYPLRAYARLD